MKFSKTARAGCWLEEKYDGIRAQAHKSGNRVKIFSRTLDEVVEFPELVAPLLHAARRVHRRRRNPGVA